MTTKSQDRKVAPEASVKDGDITTFRFYKGRETQAWSLKDDGKVDASRLTPKGIIENILRQDANADLHLDMLYMPEVDFWTQCSTRTDGKTNKVPAVIVLAWLEEEGNELVLKRSKTRGRKIQLQTLGATKPTSETIADDDIVYDC
jgi:hypothetical protein